MPPCYASLSSYAIPTPVGVNRDLLVGVGVVLGYPHARGGEPLAQEMGCDVKTLSPRPWG